MGVEIMTPPGMEDMASQLQGMFQNMGSQKTNKRKLKVKDAFKVLVDEEARKLINEDDVKARALRQVEQNGIVFLDEIDKVAKRGEYSGTDVSREGVQRDLLPLVEGCTVSTKHGVVKTDHILFIASGAFHFVYFDSHDSSFLAQSVTLESVDEGIRLRFQVAFQHLGDVDPLGEKHFNDLGRRTGQSYHIGIYTEFLDAPGGDSSAFRFHDAP